MTGSVLVSFLKAFQLICSALLVYKLYRTKLHSLYPILFAYFIFRVPHYVWILLLDTSSATYQKFWICTEPITLGFYVLIVNEICRLVLQKYKGLYTLGRWAMYVSMTVAVIISAISLLPRINPSMPQRSKIMAYVIAMDRGVNTALLIFIVVLLLILSRYPLRLSRNVRSYAVIYSIFFLANIFTLLMRTLFGMRMADEVNVVLLAVTASCVVTWLILLTPKGAETLVTGQTSVRESERTLLLQLDSINAAVLKVGRRPSSQVMSQKS